MNESKILIFIMKSHLLILINQNSKILFLEIYRKINPNFMPLILNYTLWDAC